jgi:tetratricopeptide (TPR) repeat protein
MGKSDRTLMRTRLLFALGAAIALVLRPTAAHAQLDAFVQSVRELAVATAQAEPARSNDVHAAARKMRTALVEWDRNILALEARVARELPGAAGPRAYELHVELGVTYRARGRHADALREFDAAAALKPSAADLHVLRALTLEATGRTSEAASAFRAAWIADPRDAVKTYYVVSRAGTELTADQALARRQLTETYQSLATGTARPATAPFLTLDAVADTLSRTPVVADEAAAEGFALLRGGRFGEGAASLERMVRTSEEESGTSALAHFARGQRDEAEARVGSARREYQAALPGVVLGRASLLVGIGRLAQVEGDLAGATEAFGEAARLDPNNAGIRRELAGAYAAHGRADDAFGELLAALLIDPRDGQAHAGIGQLYLDAGRDADAVSAFHRALELMPERYETRYALATAYTRLGRTAEAAREFGLFERVRREKLDERRRNIAREVEQEERRGEAPRTPAPNQGGGR